MITQIHDVIKTQSRKLRENDKSGKLRASDREKQGSKGLKQLQLTRTLNLLDNNTFSDI